MLMTIKTNDKCMVCVNYNTVMDVSFIHMSIIFEMIRGKEGLIKDVQSKNSTVIYTYKNALVDILISHLLGITSEGGV